MSPPLGSGQACGCFKQQGMLGLTLCDFWGSGTTDGVASPLLAGTLGLELRATTGLSCFWWVTTLCGSQFTWRGPHVRALFVYPGLQSSQPRYQTCEWMSLWIISALSCWVPWPVTLPSWGRRPSWNRYKPLCLSCLNSWPVDSISITKWFIKSCYISG